MKPPQASKYICSYCNIFVQDNILQRRKHEETDGHKRRRQERISESMETKWEVEGNREAEFAKALNKRNEDEDDVIRDPLTGMGEWQPYIPVPVPKHDKKKIDVEIPTKLDKKVITPEGPVAFKKRKKIKRV